MQQLGRAVGQSSIYALFQGLVLLGSLISFPILTRLLTVGEYGALALVNTTAMLLVALAKCGIATAFLRFYAQAAAAGSSDRATLSATAFWTTLVIATSIAAVYALVIALTGLDEPLLSRSVLLIVSAMVVVSALRDLYYAFLRAEQKVLEVNYTTLFLRLGGIAGGLTLVVLMDQKVLGFFVGTLIVEGCAILVLWTLVARARVLQPSLASIDLSKKLLVYGLPLLMFEFASLANDYTDRFLIAKFLGVESVGIYSVGYNLATYVQALIVAPVWMAVFPIYTRIWENQGREATEGFLHQVLRVYVAVATVILLLVMLNGASVVRLLASEKFAPSGIVFIAVCGALLLYGTTHVLGAGFHLMRRTGQLAAVTIGTAALNVVLNLALIPIYGMLGAVWSTLGSYLALTLCVSILGRRLLTVRIPWLSFLGYLGAAVLAGMVSRLLGRFESLGVDLLLHTLIPVSIYLPMIALIDREIRAWMFQAMRAATALLNRGAA